MNLEGETSRRVSYPGIHAYTIVTLESSNERYFPISYFTQNFFNSRHFKI